MVSSSAIAVDPENIQCILEFSIPRMGAKVDWDFQISDLVKNPDGTDV